MNDMELNSNKERAFQIAKEYKEKYNISGNFVGNIDEIVVLYKDFYKIEGKAWIVIAKYEENTFEDMDEFSFVISDEKEQVEYVMDTMGNPIYYPLTNDFDFTEDEIKELFNE